jgi:hypothetical protein
MAAAPRIARRLQTWLLTGPVGHFVAGALDFTAALTRYALARRRRRRAAKR